MYCASQGFEDADHTSRYLALVCIMGQDNPAEKKAIIDYNVGVFQAGLKQVFPKSDREAQVEIRAAYDGAEG